MKRSIEEIFNRTMAIIDDFPEEIRDPVRRMMDGVVGEQFFTAPASSRRWFHSSYPGGLAEHTLGVVENARRIALGLYDPLTTDKLPWGHLWKLDFCALFHDLGKVGDGTHPYYVQNKDQRSIERGYLYDIDPRCLDMPVPERGLFILHQAGVPMDADMWLGVRLSDGQYVPENAPYKLREPRIALIVHWADLARMAEEKAEEAGNSSTADGSENKP